MNSKGSDTLLQASSDCKLRLLRTVVEGGTAVDIWDNNRQTPLMLACGSTVHSEDKEKVIRYLLKKKAKVNLQDLQGRTALMLACVSNSSPSIIQALLDAKANPWLEDEAGLTSFDHAINGGDLHTTRLLINSCREHKLLLKTDNPVELKHVQDCLSKIQEMRKVSWPLMGPSVRPDSAQLHRAPAASDHVDSKSAALSLSPRLQRQRKRSICHFDPLDIGEILKSDGDIDKWSRPISPANIGDAVEIRVGTRMENGRSSCTRPPSLSQMTEEERISLHFSSTESSVEDPGSGLAALLVKMNDSPTDDSHLTNIPEIGTNEKHGDGDPAHFNHTHSDQTSVESSSFQEESGKTQLDDATSCQPVVAAEQNALEQVGITGERSTVDSSHCTPGLKTDNHGGSDQTPLKPGHTLKPPVNEQPGRGSTESLSNLSTGSKLVVSPKQRRRTLPGTLRPSANAGCQGNEMQKDGEARRRHTLGTDANKLCGPFSSQRLSPTSREFFLIDMENRKSPTSRETGPAAEVFRFSDERLGARSPINEGKANAEIRRTPEQLPAIQNDNGVQLPTISTRRKSPILYINVRGPSAMGREENTETSPRSDELWHVNARRCASPTNRGKVFPLSPARKSPLAARHEANSGDAADTRIKQAHMAQFDAFPGLQQHSASGTASQDGTKQILATSESGREELDQQKHVAQLSPRGESTNRQPSLLPPLRLKTATFGSMDSEEGYYSCSPSPFDVESPKRTPGFSEQPRYLFRPISPRSMQRFNLH